MEITKQKLQEIKKQAYSKGYVAGKKKAQDGYDNGVGNSIRREAFRLANQ